MNCGVDLALIEAFKRKGRMSEFAISFTDRQLTNRMVDAQGIKIPNQRKLMAR